MSVIAAALRELIAAGVTGDALVTAIERIEAATLPRQSLGAARQARYRERHKASQSVTSDDQLYLSSSSSSSSSSEIKKEKERKKERARGEKLPSHWSPNNGHYAVGKTLGFSDNEVNEQAEEMRLWAQSNEHRAVARKANWNTTFSGWLRRNRPNKGHLNGARSPTMEAFDDLIDQAGSREIGGDPPMRDITPGRFETS